MSAELTSLLIAARDGDDAAFVTAVRAAQPDVWRYVSHIAGRSAADDITQDTFVRAFKALPRFRGASSGRTWLLSIARRAAVDAIRRERRHHRLALRAAAERTPQAVGPADALQGLTALVDQLEVRRRDAFVLTQWIGCSYEEAANIVDVPIGTIRSRVARAREDLVRGLRAAETA
jgi:RNA polymerase sigma-70 factor, ECF subfamily